MATPTSATAHSSATVQNADRQPRYCPRNVPPGTPRIVDTVIPPMTIAIARPRAFSGTRSTAATAATPKNPALAIAPSSRVANSTS
ncbi:hypothetical protein GCM10010191_35340 [Actinomadura vinacea]|uniref:Uncharacterized protein n=1 Tax=Actinomadura vinacea TaxID=115336 RepID=A0ABN3J2Z5_9ACTN